MSFEILQRKAGEKGPLHTVFADRWWLLRASGMGTERDGNRATEAGLWGRSSNQKSLPTDLKRG